MNRFLSAACLLLPILASAQQPAADDPKRLIAELSSDDLSTREKAADRLYELRKTSEAALRAHRTEDVAVKSWVNWILSRIDERKLLDAELVLEREIAIPGGMCRALAGCPADSRFASSAPSGGLYVWNLNPLRSELWLDTGDRPVTAMAFDPAGGRIAVAAGQVAIWNLEKLAVDQKLSPAPSKALAWSCDGAAVAFLSPAGEVVIAEAATGKERSKLDLSKHRIVSLAASQEGSLLAAGEDGTVVTIAFETGKESSRLDAGAPVRAVAALPDATPIVALVNGTVRWGKTEVKVSGLPRSVATDHGGKRIAVGYAGGYAVWESDGTFAPHDSPAISFESCVVMFHPKEGRLMAMNPDGVVATWRAPDQPGFMPSTPRFRDLAWTRDDQRIVVWGMDFVFAEAATGKTSLIRDAAPGRLGFNETMGYPGPGPSQIVIQIGKQTKVWDAARGEVERDYDEAKDAAAMSPEATSPDGSLRVATEGSDGVWLRPVHAGGGGSGTALTRQNRFLQTCSWSANSKNVALTASLVPEGNVSVLVFDRKGKRLFEEVERGRMASVAIDPADRWLVWTFDGATRRMATTDLDIDHAADVPVQFFQFLDASSALGVNEKQITLWFTPEFRVARTFTLPRIDAWAVSTDTKRIAVLRAGAIRVYRIVR